MLKEYRWEEVVNPETTTDPGVKLADQTGGFSNSSDDEKVNRFRERHLEWILRFARYIISSPDESVRINGKFAVLVLLNSYVEMIGRLVCSNCPKGCGRNEAHVKAGLDFLFPELTSHLYWSELSNEFYVRFRNGIAHGVVPRHIILNEISEPIAFAREPITHNLRLVFNVEKYYFHLQDKFLAYIETLLHPMNDEENQLRVMFLERVENIG